LGCSQGVGRPDRGRIDIRVWREARATFEQAEDLREALDEMGKEMRGVS
jgi:hypothetical protein